ncbi:error-prone DNA polymerase [Idiomarina ramblicola]|uniref:Error-prone DNA polymerase n=1 Tax=Idiomarina ramblicola TaxID=263724 RepID=A0A432Z0N6_9GAMM|nr:error-prone DNA polymerase [Idiomarina ramblicola]RUO69721.1 error-prone DNA polymerase [Idiomarina ramblicola]
MSKGFYATSFAELHSVSHYSFLRSAASPEALITRADELGYTAIALTDECSVAGIVKAYQESKTRAIKLIVGSEFRVTEVGTLIVLAPTREAYAQLCKKITLCRSRSEKGDYQANVDDFFYGLSQCLLLWQPDFEQAQLMAIGEKLKSVWQQRFWLLYERHYQADDERIFQAMSELQQAIKVKVTCAGGARMANVEQQPLYDILNAIQQGGSLIHQPGLASNNAEHHLRSLSELQQCYPQQWLAESLVIAEQCQFCLSELRYEYPAELVPAGISASGYLKQLTEQGAQWRYPEGVPASVRELYLKELKLIKEQQYEPFFLTIHDLVRFAREQGILFQGRGSAANSVVCYCLGITSVDPAQIQVLFERFISKERNEPPDIDVDFEHERREEVIQYIYRKYGRQRAALAATVITYRFKSAFRDVGKALGFSEQQLQYYRSNLDPRDKEQSWQQQLAQQHPEVAGSVRGRHLLHFTGQLMGTPRHLSQHVGGFVIAADDLSRLVPVENASMADRTVIQWDKTDLESLGLLKVDVLALGMLTALRKMLALINSRYDQQLTMATIPQEDSRVYQQLHTADSMGIFQIESRAQMNMLPRLKPKTFYDLVIQIAIVRPGPIQGDMVHPFLRRRAGLEEVDYPSDEVKSVLERTLGVPIFQEQVIKLAMVAAGFSGGEADQLRRAMASWGQNGHLIRFEDKLINGMLERGYQQEFAVRLFRQICGFGQYGFPESHSASFAKLAYVSAWFKTYHPAAFYVGLLNSLPMGFYSASQLVQDAKRHNVGFLPADINVSDWNYNWLPNEEASSGETVRMGLRQIQGISETRIKYTLKQRPEEGFTSLHELRQSGLRDSDINALARADALQSIAGHRYQAHWQSLSISDQQMPLFANVKDRPARQLAAPDEPDNIKADYESTGLTLGRHPLALLRNNPELKNCVMASDLMTCRSGQVLTLAGLVTCRQRPGTRSGVTFLTLEDESGNSNVVVWAHTARQFRQCFLTSNLLWVKGIVEIHDGVVHVIAGRLKDLSGLLSFSRLESRRFH